ncbi:MAG: ATP-dependent sacrificial sulfur transferase LarE [Pyrinomonadaceae bacterium]
MNAVVSIPEELQTKYNTLRAFLRPKLAEGLLVAFSGGVDSAFLLWAAAQERLSGGGSLLAVTAESASMAQIERDDATSFAETLGVEHLWEKSAELSNPDYTINDANRCYYCKTELFSLSKNIASRFGYKWIAYGYNASDHSDFRPGHRAALENEILSPLNDANLTKNEIRELMRAFGLNLADKPASPCLSSRLMRGVFVTPQKLRDVEDMETILRRAGLKIFRVRLHEDGKNRFLRLEVAPHEMTRAIALREELVTQARARGFQWVTLDLAGYQTGGANF